VDALAALSGATREDSAGEDEDAGVAAVAAPACGVRTSVRMSKLAANSEGMVRLV